MQRQRSLAIMLFMGIVAIHLAHPCRAQTWPGKQWEVAAPKEVGMDEGRLKEARDYAISGGGSGYITRHGKLVMAWGDARQRYDLKSTSKSIGVTALGVAIADGKMRLSDKAVRFHPTLGVPPESNRDTGWIDEITILHLATQTAGFEKPGGYEKLLFRPGTEWHYSDGGPNWLAECITRVYGRDIEELLFERVFTPIGITHDDLRWRKNAYRDARIDGVMRREFGSGVHANVNAMARIGYLYLHRGKWRDRQLIPSEFVDQARTTVPQVVGLPEHGDQHGDASDHYGLLWWNNADGTLEGVPKSTYWSWGLYDSLIVVFPELDIVVARAGKSWSREGWNGHYDVLAPFFRPIVQSVLDNAASQASARKTNLAAPPYPPSPVIRGITWAPKETIVRKARGSDNWPLTWADDDALYTAYGDGRGFEPFVERKLSMGIAKVTGSPEDFHGANIRSPTGEDSGDGARGRKASGMLMVDGVLYLWVRNAGNSQLLWSTDHANTWTAADWRFQTSFGYPTFLNFGKNYSGARDGYVYVYSHDSDSAYEPADSFVLARVPKDRLRDRGAYEFFRSLDRDGDPLWTPDINRRDPVFSHPGRCYRSGITYNAALGRYLWCQTLPESDDSRGPRFQGGFGIYDAAEPWGPWTTAYFADAWDVGPGETSSIPTKWIRDDGKTIHLVFSGDDCFSVRKGTLRTADQSSGRARLPPSLARHKTFAKWSKIELAFPGPSSHGRGEPSPFAVRFDVTFNGPAERRYTVPGFYDGDGNGGLDGNVWKVRFSADEVGPWTFKTSSAEPKLDGLIGRFDVTAIASDARGFWNWGRLEYTGTSENQIRYLKFRDGPYWLKAGCDDPENFLGSYRNFDTLAERKAAVDYLANRSVNSLYMMTHNIDGDDRDVWPWLGDTPAEAKSHAVSDDIRFDVAKLNEWDALFDYMQTQGVVPYVVLEDDSAWKEFDRPRYYRELIARFGYLPALVFNLGEERNENYPLSESLEHARLLEQIDPFDHPRGIHNVNAPSAAYVDAPQVDFTSIQTGSPGAAGGLKRAARHNQIALDWLRHCRSRKRRVLVINFDEGRPELDRRAWWSAYLGGGVWEAHVLDPYDQPLSAWEPVWTELGGARAFMESMPFWELQPHNELVTAGRAFCLAKPGAYYALYLPAGGKLTVQVAAGAFYEFAWWDPANGKDGTFRQPILLPGGLQPLTAPTNSDWALRIRKATEE